jgi:hypothetical protein
MTAPVVLHSGTYESAFDLNRPDEAAAYGRLVRLAAEGRVRITQRYLDHARNAVTASWVELPDD